MSDLLERILVWGAGRVIGPRRPQLIKPAPQVIEPRPSLLVEAPARFAWDEKRWAKSTSADGAIEIRGMYHVYDRHRRQWREFEGFLYQRGDQIAAYIADPPQEIKAHRHGPCLQLVQSPWFRLHWRRQPNSLDEALIYMERMLNESLNEH